MQQLQTAAQSGGPGGTGDTALQDSSFIQQLDPTLAQPFLVGFSEAMSVVFLVARACIVFAFIATLFLPHVDLGPKPGHGGRRGRRRGVGDARRSLSRVGQVAGSGQTAEPATRAEGASVGVLAAERPHLR